MLTIANRSIAGSAAVMAALVAFSAAAPVRAETVRIPVSYSDVDLSTKDGVATVNRRIDNAADQICGGANAVNRFHTAACHKQVVADARAQFGSVQARKASAIKLAAR